MSATTFLLQAEQAPGHARDVDRPLLSNGGGAIVTNSDFQVQSAQPPPPPTISLTVTPPNTDDTNPNAVLQTSTTSTASVSSLSQNGDEDSINGTKGALRLVLRILC